MKRIEAIELRDARVKLAGREVLRIENFTLNRGVHTAIIGANGSGKSTLLQLLAGRIWPVAHDSRVYRFVDGSQTWSPIRARQSVALLSPELQEIYVRQSQGGAENERGWELDVRTCVLTGFFDSALLYQTPDAAQKQRAEALLEQLDLQSLAGRALQTLSQGQLRRVLIARALVSEPQWLFLDEACSGLDDRARAELLGHLQNLAASQQTTLVMTTHRAQELVSATQNVWEMRDGAPFPISGEAFVDERNSANSAATNGSFVDERIRVWNTFSVPKTSLVDEAISAQNRANANDTTFNSSVDERVGGSNSFVDDLAPLIELRNVRVFIEGAPVLHLMNWSWPRGAHFAVSGPNGSGKSTFLQLLAGKLAPASGGEIARFGSTKRRPTWEIAREIALVSPQLQARFQDRMSVEDAVSSGFFDAFLVRRALDEAEIARRDQWIRRLKLESLRNRTFGRLSYGQTRRVLLARALVTQPRIVLLDEALDGFDQTSRREIEELLEELAHQGVHFALASHHAEDFPALCNTRLQFAVGQLQTH